MYGFLLWLDLPTPWNYEDAEYVSDEIGTDIPYQNKKMDFIALSTVRHPAQATPVLANIPWKE